MVSTLKPGIVMETSEVFETSDLPESDQYYFPVEESDVIETLDVTTNQAFSRFQGSIVDNSKVDFSDTIRNCRRKGYVVWRGENKPKEEETAVKKYQRLNCEIRELIEEIQAAKAANQADLDGASLESLAGQIKNMKLTERNADSNNTAQAEQLKSHQLQYSLLMKPSTQSLQTGSELARLVDRLTALEACLGENKEDLDNIRVDTGKKNLSEAVSVLSSKATILEPRNLDHIEGRLALLIQRMKDEQGNEASTASSIEESETTMEKVQHLDKLMTKSNKMLQEIPDLIDRMEALNPLHTQATDLNQSILQLEVTQKQLVTQTANNSALLKEVESKLQG